MVPGVRETPLSPAFFTRPVRTVAEELIGKVLIRQSGRWTMRVVIMETEAYDGPQDAACHGRFGRTKRTAPLFEAGGCFYVYLCYGTHWMLNVVTGETGYPAAVLIRGAIPEDGTVLDGPGKLTKALDVSSALSGVRVAPSSGLWIADIGKYILRGSIQRSPRVGIAYAGSWAERPWRYTLRSVLPGP